MTDPFSPVLRRVPAEGARREWQVGEVVEVRRETAHAKTFRIALPRWVRHVAGQHYVLRLTAPDGYVAQRDYSVSSAPDDEGVVELTVDRLADGEVSGHLHDVVEVGDRLELRGPFGGFFVWRGGVPALLVGGGSGVAPLMSMLRHARRSGGEAHLVASFRTAADVWFAPELDGQTVVLSRERPEGRLRAEDLAPHVGPDVVAYVCGSTGFCDAATGLLTGLGLPVDRLRVERFGAGGATG